MCVFVVVIVVCGCYPQQREGGVKERKKDNKKGGVTVMETEQWSHLRVFAWAPKSAHHQEDLLRKTLL